VISTLESRLDLDDEWEELMKKWTEGKLDDEYAWEEKVFSMMR
jgi:hypothetical protein